MAETTNRPSNQPDNLWTAPGESAVPEPRVKRVPAGGHFASRSAGDATPRSTVGGAAAVRQNGASLVQEDEVPRPAGARFAAAGSAPATRQLPVNPDPSTTMQFVAAWKASGHTDEEMAALIPAAPSSAQTSASRHAAAESDASAAAPVSEPAVSSARTNFPSMNPLASAAPGANGETVAMGGLAAASAAAGAAAAAATGGAASAGASTAPAAGAAASGARTAHPSVSDLNIPSPTDTFASMAAASLWGPAADDAAVTATTNDGNLAAPTGKLVNGSANMSSPTPAETAEFLAMANARGRRTAPAAGADVPPTPPAGPSNVASPQPVYPPQAVRTISMPADSHRKRGAANPYAAGNGGGYGGRGGNGSGDGGNGKKGGRGRSIASVILIVVGVALLAAAAFIFVRAQMGYQEAQSTYADLQQYAVQDSSGDGVPQVDFDELEAINPDVIGWIYVPNTVINYPVVQTDNNTTYLSRLFDLSGNGSGTIFMDMDGTAPGAVDQQTTLYGHHMYDSTMFKIVDDTLKQDAFDAFGNVYYITRENTYVFKPLFTAQVMDTYTDARVTNFTGDPSLTQYLQDMLGQAKAKAADAEERIESTDKVLSLVTCAGEIIPRTTRAVMVCSLEETIERQ